MGSAGESRCTTLTKGPWRSPKVVAGLRRSVIVLAVCGGLVPSAAVALTVNVGDVVDISMTYAGVPFREMVTLADPIREDLP